MQEVRVAMALNGGVSLAVWMGGCAVELDRARRAGAGEETRIYDSLCRCFGRELVIDILTGASAGGINGALLSAAMVSGNRLDAGFVRSQWLDLGDLSDLLYPTTKEDPQALMDGELFHKRLLRAFEAVLGVDPGAPGYAECASGLPVRRSVPSLDVTMTDVLGVEKRFKDAWGGELIAREHRPRFKFRERAHFSANALAAAARTSSSFPFAFAPWPVNGDPRVLAGLSNPTYGIDGGLLDNAPIEAALELIPSKPADSRVLRYVCYLNGDPVVPMDEIGGKEPDLRAVGGYVVNLPRVAPFVDQLYAIKRAVERPRHSEQVQLKLLQMDRGELSGVARALFDTYRERRTMQSLEELLGDPGEATAMNGLLSSTDGWLPWIPFRLEHAPGTPWRWGIRPAQRILHLLLDLLRTEIPAAGGRLREDLLAVRATIDAQLSVLGEAREQVLTPQSLSDPARISEEPPLERLQKAVTAASDRADEAYDAVRVAAEAVHELTRAYPEELDKSPLTALFREAGPEREEWLSVFLRRVLSIEVIRRAFSAEAEIESAEELRFVQLTPAAPSPIFTPGPLRLPSPASASAKLAGVGLGHFAGFYRRSWRANDFMWGRLDAAARLVDLLLDRPSDEIGVGADASGADRAEARAECLVEALLPENPPSDLKPDLGARRWLLQEAIDDAAVSEGIAPGEALPPPALRAAVKEAIEAELLAATPGAGVEKLPFTRAVLQRAAQLEIVDEELPVIRRETGEDSKLGSAVPPFPPQGETRDLAGEVKAVRDLYEEDSSLPKRLIDDEEVVSDLGLRTITHAAAVALSAVRTAKAPLSNFFGVVRAPLSAVAATVAKNPLHRATAGLGFWAAAIYLTSRLVTADPESKLLFSSVWSWATLTALIAALGAIGFAAVPIVRVWRGVRPLLNSLLTAGLLGFAYVFVAIWAAIVGFKFSQILFVPGAENPPRLVVLAPLFALGVVSASRLPLPGWLGKASGLIERFRSSRFFVLPLAGTFALLAAWAGVDLWNAGFDGGASWHLAGALFAFLATPIVVTASLKRWKLKLPRRRKRL
jgi:predicted acylesterase/phospholipase RssA